MSETGSGVAFSKENECLGLPGAQKVLKKQNHHIVNTKGRVYMWVRVCALCVYVRMFSDLVTITFARISCNALPWMYPRHRLRDLEVVVRYLGWRHFLVSPSNT